MPSSNAVTVSLDVEHVSVQLDFSDGTSVELSTVTPVEVVELDLGGRGPQGDPGAAATIAVGTVTTGAAGSSASVTNVGTSSAAVLDFAIPRGATGAAGSTGAPGSVWRNGSGVPSNSLGVNGDYYLDNVTGDVYLRNAGTYSVVANIKGPAGGGSAVAWKRIDFSSSLDGSTVDFTLPVTGGQSLVTNSEQVFGKGGRLRIRGAGYTISGNVITTIGADSPYVSGDDLYVFYQETA